MNTESNKIYAKLERERDILRAEVEDLKRERDEANAENDSLRAALTEQLAAAENEKLHAAAQSKFCGNDILDAIVRSDSIENIIIENRAFIIIWKANAAEQIEAALEEVTNASDQRTGRADHR